MSKKSDDQKNVVVVGAGAAGASVARGLSGKLDPSKYKLTVINPRPYSIHLIAAARLTVSEKDKMEDVAYFPYDKLFINGNGSLKIGSVASINANKGGQGGELVLKDGERVPYDILVLAPGSIWPGPLNLPEDRSQLDQHVATWRAKYKNAKEIVLVGAGAVGLETAGEIKDQWPDKKVTIIQGDDLPLNKTYPTKLRKAAAQSVEARGVEIILQDYVDEFPAEGVVGVTTRNGKKLNADLVVPTYGPRPNTEFVASLGPDVLNAQGRVKVKPTLQLQSYPDIYAAGDVIDWNEQKQAAKTPGHAAVVVANILDALTGKTPAKEYKGATELIVVTNGRNGGLAYFDILWGIMLGNWFARFVKSKDLLVPMARKNVGLQ